MPDRIIELDNPPITVIADHIESTIIVGKNDGIRINLNRENTLGLARLLDEAGEHLETVHERVERMLAEEDEDP